jgi:hypothetical protein
MASTRGYPKYYKYRNPDPSTAKNAPIVTAEILEKIADIIDKDIWRIYRLKSDTVLGIDLKHAVTRDLSNRLLFAVAEIDKFEKQNASDLRNYPWVESDGDKHEDTVRTNHKNESF